jgi:hypothetical protein
MFRDKDDNVISETKVVANDLSQIMLQQFRRIVSCDCVWFPIKENDIFDQTIFSSFSVTLFIPLVPLYKTRLAAPSYGGEEHLLTKFPSVCKNSTASENHMYSFYCLLCEASRYRVLRHLKRLHYFPLSPLDIPLPSLLISLPLFHLIAHFDQWPAISKFQPPSETYVWCLFPFHSNVNQQSLSIFVACSHNL